MPVEARELPTLGEKDDIRRLAWRLNVPEGLRVEVLGGAVMVSPLPVPKHYVIGNRIHTQLHWQLSGQRMPTMNGPGIAPDIDRGDYAVPDLTVAPTARFYEDAALVPASDIDLVGEIVSRENARRDTLVLPDIYADWEIPVYLLVDPRTGEITLFTEPKNGAYIHRECFRFGEEVSLPTSLDSIRLSTADFPRYRKS
ncbi:Uma2 family endonuclease [Nocardiopsis gilva YIM 90087]|uniref:Uma2 family endonuclease n=1 Tax=Nocardiopsis gilva YIM 90087 TaxID=1235441 RepID=A0A223SAE1_9ACTN|nr:Uma2 family endonuclease [Nocardiopsis gilva]ASU85085.1 Uma2 family endonuclease [Nocardiopsis gilva YIM 90087]